MNFSPKPQKTPLKAGLYFVATPIGSARDITLRGLDILASADVIAAEDTRTARKLMEIHGIALENRQLIALHDHSSAGTVTHLTNLVKTGQSIAYVSEAGTPLISDPGFELSKAMIKESLYLTSAPGASAVLTALTLAGLPTDKFCFLGFLPSQAQQRCNALQELQALPFTMVFYESPKRLNDLLINMRDILGASRKAAVCRELTKKFEEVNRGTLEELAELYASRQVKGEIVVLVEKPSEQTISQDDMDSALIEAMSHMRIKDAATAVAGALNLPKRDVYQRALALKSKQNE